MQVAEPSPLPLMGLRTVGSQPDRQPTVTLPSAASAADRGGALRRCDRGAVADATHLRRPSSRVTTGQ